MKVGLDEFSLQIQKDTQHLKQLEHSLAQQISIKQRLLQHQEQSIASVISAQQQKTQSEFSLDGTFAPAPQ